MALGPKIVIIFGASGSGKTTLLSELRKSSPQISIHAKAADRPKKKYDQDEIVSVSQVSDKDYDYIYSAYGHHYGIQRSQIDASLLAKQDHFIICNDIITIERLKEDYGERVEAVFLVFDAPREQIAAVQKRRKIPDDEINLRLTKISVLTDIFLNNADIFDGVIINRLGAPVSDMVEQLHLIMNNKSGNLLAKNTAEIARAVHCNLLESQSHTAIQKGYVFIIMPIQTQNPDLEETHRAIKLTAANYGLKAQRADDIIHNDAITDKILGSIKCAECIVADLTNNRPNVYYEIGYAHSQGKPTILIAKEGTQAHFDLQGFNIVVYRSAFHLQEELGKFFERFRAIGD
jgi:guanylate kinase